MSNNLKYDHVFAVVRYDYFNTPSGINFKNDFNVLKIFVNEAEAEEEAKRLNQLILERLGNEADSIYYVLLTRIKKGLLKHSPENAANE